jgi:hypothetical protein
MIVDAPWYMPNTLIHKDLQISTVKEEMYCYNSGYNAHLRAQPNDLVVDLMEQPDNKK